MRISDLQAKDVINVADGSKIGRINDIEIDLKKGEIKKIIVPTETKFFGLFSGGQDVVIPWEQIVKIGSDVILVRVGTHETKLPFLEEYTKPRGTIGKIN